MYQEDKYSYVVEIATACYNKINPSLHEKQKDFLIEKYFSKNTFIGVY